MAIPFTPARISLPLPDPKHANHTLSDDESTSSSSHSPQAPARRAVDAAESPARSHRGPALYLAVGGLLGASAAIPLVAPFSIYTNPNPIGYLLVLLGVPIGGLAYRIRSRNWPMDAIARDRQVQLSAATLLLPASIALLTGLRTRGFFMMIIGLVISASFSFGIMISGTRRQRSG